MKDKLKRFLSLLLAFVMVLSIVPVSAEDLTVVVDETNTTEGSVGETVPVAKIGDENFATLKDAFVAATAGEETTIILLRDVTEVVQLSVSDTTGMKNIILDLNEHTWDCGYGTRINAVTLKIKNGTIGTRRWNLKQGDIVDVFHFGGHSTLPSTLNLTGVTFNAELHVNNMAPSDEELDLLKSMVKSTEKAPNATTVIIWDGQYDVVTVQSKAYLTLEGGFFSGINVQEGAFFYDDRDKTDGDKNGTNSEEGKTGEIVEKKDVTIMSLPEYNYARTESGLTLTFVDATPIEERESMKFTAGANSTTFIVQRLEGDKWVDIDPVSGTSTVEHVFTEPGTVTYRCDWDKNGTYDRLVVLVKAPVAKVGNQYYTSIDEAVAAWTDGTTLTLLADTTVNLGSPLATLANEEMTQADSITADEGESAIVIGSGHNVTLYVNEDITLTGGKGGAGIYVAEDASLTIKGSGTLTAIGNGGEDTEDSGAAGIGGTYANGNSGAITIDGATVVAKGYGKHGSGIGSGSGEVVGEIKIINDANVTAYGGYYSKGGKLPSGDKYGDSLPEGGAAIGGGGKTSSTIANITITDSTVAAYGGSKAAGIGANFWSSVSLIDIDNSTVTAEGGVSSAGIGTSRAGGNGVSATINITSSNVDATGGYHGAGIGGGYNNNSLSNLPISTVTIDGNSVVNARGANGGAGIGGGYKTNNYIVNIEDTAKVNAFASILNDGSDKTIDQTCSSAIGSGANGSGTFKGGSVSIADTATVEVTTEFGGKPAIEGDTDENWDARENVTVFMIDKPVAQVGEDVYTDIDEAIANWTNNTTLTLLADVTLSDVITLKSTEHHILNLGTYTMTAASGKNAIEIKSYGFSNRVERAALTINADGTNPGGINAGSKSCIYYKYDSNLASNNYDRPVIYINGGVFTGGSNSGISCSGHTSAQDKCATFNISGGTFNCGLQLTKAKLIISGGTFNGSLNCTGGSTSYRVISGGTFKSFGFMTADAANKFGVGSALSNYDRGLYVTKDNYLVVCKELITDTSNFALSTTHPAWHSYLTYSSVPTKGLFYEKETIVDLENVIKTTAAQSTDQTINLYQERTLSKSIDVKNNLTLNLNGYDLTHQGFVLTKKYMVLTSDTKLGLENVTTSVAGFMVAEDEVEIEGKIVYTYTVSEAVAQIGDTPYSSLQAAADASVDGDIIKVLVSHKVDKATVVDKNVTIDLNGTTITTAATAAGTYVDAFTILADVTITGNGTIDARPSHGYTFYVGDKEGNAGTLTIENGSFYGETSVVNNRLGTVYIQGGSFEVSLEKIGDTYDYVLNCIDDNYNAGTAQIVVTGGTFHNFDPMNNEAEGKETNFVAEGYVSETKDDGATYTVRKANYIAQVGDVKYEDLKEAIEACTNGETVELIADVVYGSDDVVYAHGGATGFGKHDASNPSIVYIGGTKGATDAENKPSNVNAVINLNSHSITNNADAYLFLFMDNAKVTFVGDGSITSIAKRPIFWATGAETLLRIDGGTYTTANNDGLLWSTHSGDVVVNGGYFSTTADDASLLFMLNTNEFNNPNYFLKGQATLNVYGGTFKGFNPEVTMDDSKKPFIETNAVADGYKAVDNGDGTWTVKPLITVTFGDVTVVEGNEMPTEFTFTTNFTEFADDGTMLVVEEPDFTALMVDGKLPAGEYDITADAYVFMSGKYAVEVIPGTLTVQKAVAVVKEDQDGIKVEYYYATLQEPASLGKTFSLLCDVELTETLEIEHKGTYMKLEGHSITGNLETLIHVKADGTVQISGNAKANLQNTGDVVFVESGNLSIYGEVTLTSNNANCIYVRGGNTTVQKATLIAKGAYPAIQGNGNYEGNVSLYETNVTKASVTSSNDIAIYWPNNGNLTINGGVITGKTAVYAKSGKITINGGTFNGNGAADDFIPNDNGATATGDAVVIEASSNPAYEQPSVSITGGTFQSVNALAVATYGEGMDGVKFITGGVFSSDPTDLCVDGYVGEQGEDGMWNVVKATIRVGSENSAEAKWFIDLQKALDYAMSYQVYLPIFLLADITVDETIIYNDANIGNCELQGKYTITGSSNAAPLFQIEKGIFTVKDVTINAEGDAFHVKGGTLNIQGGGNTSGMTKVNSATGSCIVVDGGKTVVRTSVDLNANGNEPAIKSTASNTGSLSFEAWKSEYKAVPRVNANADVLIDWLNGELNLTQGVFTGKETGISISNNSASSATIENCTINAGKPVVLKQVSKENAYTLKFVGNNTLTGENWLTIEGNGATVKVDLTEDNSELNIETVSYDENYYVTKKIDEKVYEITRIPVAAIGDVQYTTLQAAIDAAKEGDTIVVLTDINLADVEMQKLDGYDTYFLVEGKSVTIDLNGKTISGAYTGSMLVGVFSTDNNGKFTLTGNGTVDVTATNKVYALIVAYNDGSAITIENGTYKLDKASDSLIYYGGETDAAVTVKGGTFTLGNVGEGENGKPWIFNVLGAGDHHVLITGGTFNADINRQHWSNEAVVAKTHYVVKNDNGTWTVKDGAVAYVKTGMLTGPYSAPKDVGYATIEEAFAAAVTYNDVNITLLKNVSLTKDVEISIAGIVLNADTYTLDCDDHEIVLTTETATLTAAEGLNVTTDLEGYAVEYDAENGLYKVAPEQIPVTVTINDAEMIFGNELPEFTYTVDPEGVEVIVEDYKVVDENNKPVDVTAAGTYYITANVKVEEPYVVTVVNGTLAVKLFDIVGVNVAAQDSLRMNFYVKKTDLNGEGYYAVVTKKFADGREDVVSTIDFTNWSAAGSNYRFGFSDISAKEMSDLIYVTVYNTEGVAVSNEYIDSIRLYATRMIEKNDGELRTALVDMLNYGAAAQQYFKYDTGNLANTDIAGYQQYATTSVTYEDHREAGENYVGSTVSAKDRLLLTFVFKNITTDMTATITYVDHYGNNETMTVAGSSFIQQGDLYGIAVTGLAVADGRQLVTCEVKDADGNVVASAMDSIESYCARQSSLSSVFEYLMKFVQSAYNYFNQ